MATPPNPGSPRSAFLLALAIVAMIAVPAALTLHTVKVSTGIDAQIPNPTPYGYTVSLLLFIVPVLVIGLWFVPREGVHIAKKSFAITFLLLFLLGASLDFFFAARFFRFPNPGATLRITAPAIGGGVPIEEYVFYLTGFLFTLLLYIWLDEYWLSAYGVPSTHWKRTAYERILRFHPASLVWAVVLIAAGILYKRFVAHEAGFPGYFTFLVAGALAPSAALFPSALPVVNWRAFSLTMFIVLLISLLWEATLGVPYGWWGFQDAQMIGIRIVAWSRLPIEEVFVWVAVTYATVIVYENVRRWQSTDKALLQALFGEHGLRGSAPKSGYSHR
jgi:lycopene cyclase domain-containing protein